MALNLIPKDLETLNRGEKYVITKLQNIYKNCNYDAFLYLEPKIRNLYPDFILIDPLYGVAIIEVKDYDINAIKKISNKEIVLTHTTTYNPSYRVRQYYNTLKGLFSVHPKLLDEKGNLKFKLNAFLFLNNISYEEVKNIEHYLSHYPTQILFKEDIKNLSIDKLFKEKAPLSKKEIELIRISISPEIAFIKNNELSALDKEQEEFAKRLPKGHYHISGVPGSGKTVIVIARAVYLKKLNPEANIAILAYNNSLKSKIEERLEEIEEKLNLQDIKITDIEVNTFHKFIYKYVNISLNKLKKDDKFFKETLPKIAMENITPEYDAILIDEYQDFYEDWIKACIKAIIPKDGLKNILLAGDRLQSIYNPNEINFKKSFGLDMRGRSKLFKKTYRTFDEGIKLGLKLLSQDEKYKKEIEKFYEGIEDIETINKDGNLIFYKNYKEIINYLLNSNKETLILAPSWNSANYFYSILPAKLKRKFKVSKEVLGKHTITTYHSSKGLEAPLVVLLNFDKIKDVKLKYVALTRSSEILIINSYKNSI